MAAFDQMRLLYLKKIATLYSVDIETDKICQTKKKKDMLDSENQKQSFRKFCKFHRNVCDGVSFLVKLLAFNFIKRDSNTGVFL